jgi:hypothetical protein
MALSEPVVPQVNNAGPGATSRRVSLPKRLAALSEANRGRRTRAAASDPPYDDSNIPLRPGGA